MVLCWLVSLAAVIWMSCRGSVAWHPKNGCKGDYMLIWAQWFCYLCILHPWAQCSESVKSRVPSKWFVSKNQDFLVAREQKLGCRGHRDLLLNSQEYCLLTNSLWQPSQPPLLTQPSPAPLLTQSTNHFCHGLMLISLPRSRYLNVMQGERCVTSKKRLQGRLYVDLSTVILLPLRPASLTHKNTQRCKIICGMRPIWGKDWLIDPKMIFCRISCFCDFCGCSCGYCYKINNTYFF